MLLHFGGKAHRCRVCRYNFVSFMNRKEPKPAADTKGSAAA